MEKNYQKMLKMNCNIKKHWVLFTFFCGVINLYAQKEQNEINKEDVVVEFSFNPTLSDVFKLKTNPTTKHEFKKEAVNYQIFSKKVKSDFKPIIKKASYVKIDKPSTKNYLNYIYGAVGLYGNGELEVILRPKPYQKYKYGVQFFNYNNQKGIADKRIGNAQLHSNLGLFVGKDLKKLNWRIDALYDRNLIHWYGLNSDITNLTQYKDKDFKQVYNTFNFKGKIDYKKGPVNSLTPSIQFFSDNNHTTEINLKANTVLNKSIFKDYINAEIDFEYLNGSFSQNYINDTDVDYSFINLGAKTSYTYVADNFKIDAGLDLILNINSEASDTNLFFLPKIIASIPLIKNIMTLQGGFRSNFTQNSYASLVKQNVFVSPTLNIQATDIPVDMFLGLQGKLSKAITYHTEGSYRIENNKALFKHNNSIATLDQPYQLGNTFSVLYDDVKVFTVKGNIEITFLKNLRTGFSGILNNYTTDVESEAWNLPNFVLETYANYELNKWFAQAGLNIVNGRKDEVNNNKITVNGFLDVNLKGGYKINKQLNAHLNIYNLLNNKYETFNNYQVQEFQALVGLSYKF